MNTILLIESDEDLTLLLEKFLQKNGLTVFVAGNVKNGIQLFEKERTDLILCNLNQGENESEVIQRLKEIEPSVKIITMSDTTDLRTAVNAMKNGAFEFFSKPLNPDELLQTINRALQNGSISNSAFSEAESNDAIETTSYSRVSNTRKLQNEIIFGKSSQSVELQRQIELVAPTNYSVIIYGESGVGKEAIAQTIHRKSKRAKQPFVAMDCGAISKELAGSELFGHEKGSFTGAHATKIGHFELANGGTIFLDEIANLPYDVQSSLLRVVQERKVKRIGGHKEIPIDVRIIVASNENLSDAYKRGKFREDLFHRFNEFHLSITPLRERPDDILLYAQFFLEIAGRELDKKVCEFSLEVEKLFEAYPWHGNLREMKNVIRRAVLLTDHETVESRSLPQEIRINAIVQEQAAEKFSENPAYPVQTGSREEKTNLKSAALEAEYELILKVLKEVRFNKSKAAKILNIDRKTLYNKMRAYDNTKNTGATAENIPQTNL